MRAGDDLSQPNPEQNTCCNVITLSLADGTPLWQSERVAPGELSDPIRLQAELEPGSLPGRAARLRLTSAWTKT